MGIYENTDNEKRGMDVDATLFDIVPLV